MKNILSHQLVRDIRRDDPTIVLADCIDQFETKFRRSNAAVRAYAEEFVTSVWAATTPKVDKLTGSITIPSTTPPRAKPQPAPRGQVIKAAAEMKKVWLTTATTMPISGEAYHDSSWSDARKQHAFDGDLIKLRRGRPWNERIGKTIDDPTMQRLHQRQERPRRHYETDARA